VIRRRVEGFKPRGGFGMMPAMKSAYAAIGLGIFVASALLARAGEARNPHVTFPPDPERLPAVRYGKLASGECLTELAARRIAYKDGKKAPTIETPVTLEGALRGVRFEFAHPVPDHYRDVLDCRLLLALDDLAAIAREREIAVVRYNSIFRRGWARARGQRHIAGVAIDIVEFEKENGVVLNVKDDFAGGGVGSATCGDRARPAATAKAAELRDLVCALDRARVFNLLLTPHYDRRHSDHFHFEVRRGISWFLTQ